MFTRCPNCGTRFKVHPEQLVIADGKVRCGHCDHVFDAREAAPVNPQAAASIDQAAPPTTAIDFAPPPHNSAWRDAGWLLACLLAALLLAAQFAWWERHRLVSVPPTQPWVQWMCRHLPCDLQPFQAPRQIRVLARDLQPIPGQVPALRLSVRFESTADRPQAYPLLELALLDPDQRLLGRRRFTPARYLGQNPERLLAPHVPVEATLELRDPGVQTVGFRISFH